VLGRIGLFRRGAPRKPRLRAVAAVGPAPGTTALPPPVPPAEASAAVSALGQGKSAREVQHHPRPFALPPPSSPGSCRERVLLAGLASEASWCRNRWLCSSAVTHGRARSWLCHHLVLVRSVVISANEHTPALSGGAGRWGGGGGCSRGCRSEASLVCVTRTDGYGRAPATAVRPRPAPGRAAARAACCRAAGGRHRGDAERPPIPHHPCAGAGGPAGATAAREGPGAPARPPHPAQETGFPEKVTCWQNKVFFTQTSLLFMENIWPQYLALQANGWRKQPGREQPHTGAAGAGAGTPGTRAPSAGSLPVPAAGQHENHPTRPSSWWRRVHLANQSGRSGSGTRPRLPSPRSGLRTSPVAEGLPMRARAGCVGSRTASWLCTQHRKAKNRK